MSETNTTTMMTERAASRLMFATVSAVAHASSQSTDESSTGPVLNFKAFVGLSAV
jgi:hypothetical protein